MGCLHPKPKGDEVPPEKVKKRDIIRRESQRPWNRASNQVYCGEPKKNATADSKASEGIDDGKKLEGVNVDNNNESSAVSNKTADGNEVTNSNLALVRKDFWDEMKFSIPKIVTQPPRLDVPLNLYPPPEAVPYDPSARIVNRPRSLDTVMNYYNRPINKTRPLSYSPGLIKKTKHPRCLHSIEEIPKFRERPKSIDFSVFFQGDKDSENNIQKLRRLLTQKSPRKSKTHPDHYVLDRVILQVRTSGSLGF